MAAVVEQRPNLDLLRSIAVSTVLVSHLVRSLEYQLGYTMPLLTKYAAPIGHCGVLAFFVHTSLVLMYSLDRLDRPGTRRVALRFYIRRFFRIYPLSLLCVLAALMFGFPSNTWKELEPITSAVVAANILLVQNVWTKISVVGPLWSLPYEIQMYIVLPLLHRVARRARPVTGLLVLIGLFCGAGTAIALATGHLNMAAYIPCFLAGVLCYALGKKSRPVVPAYVWPFWLLVLIAYYCLTNWPDILFWTGWIYCLEIGLTINLFHESTSRWLNLLSASIAKYSYGLYLWHTPVLYIVLLVLGVRDPLAASLLFIVLTFLASIVTYHAVEAPLIRLGARLSSGRRPLKTLAGTSRDAGRAPAPQIGLAN